MASLQTDPCHLQHRNPAIQYCCQLRNRALTDCKGLKIDGYNASKLADRAYLMALPELYALTHILDYASCINHAVALQIIQPADANAMLASAKLALATLRAEKSASELDFKKESRQAASATPPQDPSQAAA
jgi:hypothetical protein